MEIKSCFLYFLMFYLASTVVDSNSITEVDHQIPFSLCQNYQGNVCKNFIGNHKIYVRPSDNILLKERSIEAVTENFSSYSYDVKCKDYALQYLCYNAFPFCDDSTAYPAPRQICRYECEWVQFICWQAFDYMKNIIPNTGHNILPVCKELPPMHSPESYNCLRIGLSHGRNDEENPCFGKYSMYTGKKDTTISGQKCQPWSLQNSYQTKFGIDFMGGHSYCRSPYFGRNPWCFTVPDVRKEMCSVPFCGRSINNGPVLIRQVQIMKITKNSLTFDIITSELVQAIEVRYDKRGKSFKSGDIYEIGGLNPGETYSFDFFPVDAKRPPLPYNESNPFMLTVSDIALLPDKPEIIFQNLEENKVKVQWIRKENAIDQYELKYCVIELDEESKWTSSTFSVTIDLPSKHGSNYTIAGLASKTYYELQLRAHTMAGFGEPCKYKFYID